MAARRRCIATVPGDRQAFLSHVRFAEYLRANADFEFTFVAPTARIKLTLLRQGFSAYTIAELYRATRASPFPGHIPAHLCRFDRLIGHMALPFEDCPTCAGGPDLEEYYAWESERVLAAYSHLMDAVRPHVVFTWNGSLLVQAASAYLARNAGIPVFYLERGLLPGALVVDPDGVNYGSRIAGAKWGHIETPEPTAAEVEALEEYCRGLRERAVTVVMSGKVMRPGDLRAALNVPARTRVVLFPLQIETDSNVVGYSPSFRTMPEIITALQEAIADETDLYLVVKPHPEDKDRSAELEGLCDGRTRVSWDADLHSLFAIADVVVTVNSTTGLEALVCRKPVVVLGQAIYGGKGFTFDVERREQVPQKLREALAAARAGDFPGRPFLRFLRYLLKNCLFSVCGEDQWGSRAEIARQIVRRSEAVPGPQCGRADDLLTPLKQANREIVRHLCCDTGGAAGQNLALLLLGRDEALLTTLRALRPEATIHVASRQLGWWEVSGALLGRYDLAITSRLPRGLLRKAIWLAIRAKSRVILESG